MAVKKRMRVYNAQMNPDIQTYARKGLEAELARLDAERERVRALLASLDGASPEAITTIATLAKRPRQMSEAGRQAIREAVKRRWEKARAAAVAGISDVGVTSAESVKQAAAKPVPGRAQGRSRAKATRGNRKK